MPIKAIGVAQLCRAWVLIELPQGRKESEITESMIQEAIKQQLESEGWEPIVSEPVAAAIFPVKNEDACGLPVYRPFGTGQTIDDRAKEIGVSVNTLHRWKRGGTDIWSDDAVRTKVSKGRNWQPHINPRFKPRL